MQRDLPRRDGGLEVLILRTIALADSEYPDPIDKLDIVGRGVGDLCVAAAVKRAQPVQPLDVWLGITSRDQNSTTFIRGEIVAFLTIAGSVFELGQHVHSQ